MIKRQMSRTRKVQPNNLLGNTLQYPSNDGLVRIKIVKWDDFVVMDVADTDIGVAIAEHGYQHTSGNDLLRITGLSNF